MRDAADMPHLQDDPYAGFVYGIGHLAPAVDLDVGMDPRRARRAHAFGTNLSRLGHDQRRIGTLLIIGGIERMRNVPLVRPVPGHRRHDDTVRQLERADRKGCKQINQCQRLTLACSSRTAHTAAVSFSARPCSSVAR